MQSLTYKPENYKQIAPTRDHPFYSLYVDFVKPPHLVAFCDHAGDTEDTFST